MNLRNKSVTVIGLGQSGFAAAKFLLQKKAVVFATDHSAGEAVRESAETLRRLGAFVETGGHTDSALSSARLVVASPGVPTDNPVLAAARKKKIPVISEVELASYFCEGDILAITGSNGKTTTSHLLHRILKQARKPSVLCGNVGQPFIDFIPRIRRGTSVVLELSSFQLEVCPCLAPKLAIVLNVSRNHLDRHKTFENYLSVKQGIFKNQSKTDFTILNYDDAAVRAMAKKTKARVIFFSQKPLSEGVFIKEGRVFVSIRGRPHMALETKDIPLQGNHNQLNILACVAAASLVGVHPRSLQKSLNSFKTLEHRMEPVGDCAGVTFVNDSKSTTVESTKAALLAVQTPVILVAGGRDKGAKFKGIESVLRERAKFVVLYGEAREKIASSWKRYDRYALRENFTEAVQTAVGHAERGDTLLLSPMCTSFDQFNSFEERGEAFKKIFEELRTKKEWT